MLVAHLKGAIQTIGMAENRKKRSLNVRLSEQAHRVIRRWRVDGGLTSQEIVERALLKFDAETSLEALQTEAV